MPRALERRLKRRAHALHLNKQRTNAYVYGTLRRLGWKPSKRTGKRKKRK